MAELPDVSMSEIRGAGGHIHDISESRLLYEGPASRVYSAMLQHPRKTIAAKTGASRRKYAKEPHDIVKEYKILSVINHENIIQVIDYHADPGEFSIWMPFIPYSLQDLLQSPFFAPVPAPYTIKLHGVQEFVDSAPGFFVEFVMSLIFQILSAVAFLHDPSRAIAHRDIKPGNLLLDAYGCVKLVDFGVAYAGPRADDGQSVQGMWPEEADNKYVEVSTGPYRAPELLFGSRDYFAFAADLWSLGATLAEFFTPLRLLRDEGDEDDAISSGIDRPEDGDLPSHIIPFDAERYPRTVETIASIPPWSRDSLFDASRGDIGLIWSICRIRGTPSEANWPRFGQLPNADRVTFEDVPPVDLRTLLPNLPRLETGPGEVDSSPPSHFPPAEMQESVMDMIHRFLVYPPLKRLQAADALLHPCLRINQPLLMPSTSQWTSFNGRKSTSSHATLALGTWVSNLLRGTAQRALSQ